MFDHYLDYYGEKIPYTGVHGVPVSGLYSMDILTVMNRNYEGEYIYYMDPLRSYIKRRLEVVKHRKEQDTDTRYQRVILVSNDWNRIRKSAQILSERQELYDRNLDLEELEDEMGEEDGLILNGLLEIDLAKDISEEKAMGNPYVTKAVACKGIAENAGNMITAGFLYKGLTLALLKEQSEALTTDTLINIFIGIPKEMVDLPEIQRLLYERGFDLVRLPDMDLNYYRQVADEMIIKGGVPFRDEEGKKYVLNAILKKCGAGIGEEAISQALTLARLRMNGEKVFLPAHFSDFLSISAKNATEILQKKTGLRCFKEAVEEFLAVEWEGRRNPKAQLSCRHLVFEGNPGCGKTMCASLFAEILSLEGLTNGVFTIAARKDIIGKYVGHTAPKIARLFERSRGGVLFVDEAGFFLNERSGGFVEESVKEFVRYMELYRDVIVIFAFYPGEAKRFLRLDEGLRSRIAATITFEDYSQEELAAIFREMAAEKGYRIGKSAEGKAVQILSEYKKKSGKQFGNAREARKLCDAAVRAVAIRHRRESVTSGKKADYLTVQDLTHAAGVFREESSRREIAYGFDTGNAAVMAI